MGQSFDLIVVGAGVMGLWCARQAARCGVSTCLIEAVHAGAGASGTPLGALMPHLPSAKSDDLTRLQLAGLNTLADRIAEVEALTGIACGYRRCGRVMPMASETALARARDAVAAAPAIWGQHEVCRIVATPADAGAGGWLAPEAAPFGVLHESLSAVVEPRRLLASLERDFCLAGGEIRMARFARWDEARGAALAPDGSEIAVAAALLITAGAATFQLPDVSAAEVAGRGIKGHAAVLRPRIGSGAVQAEPGAGVGDVPLVYGSGLYAARRGDGSIALGSTTEPNWTDVAVDPAVCDGLIARVEALCPAARGAAIVERWAGLRPRAETRRPVVGRMHAGRSVFIATGGYKISFAIAHLAADAIVADITGAALPLLPAAFRPPLAGCD